MHTFHTHTARGFWQRFRGLMFSAQLPADQAFFIPRCTSVHTCFMRYSIDLVYVDAKGVIVSLAPHVKPWRMSRAGKPARHVVELAAGGIARSGMCVGNHTPWCD